LARGFFRGDVRPVLTIGYRHHEFATPRNGRGCVKIKILTEKTPQRAPLWHNFSEGLHKNINDYRPLAHLIQPVWNLS
jgi:hypothetical protein